MTGDGNPTPSSPKPLWRGRSQTLSGCSRCQAVRTLARRLERPEDPGCTDCQIVNLRVIPEKESNNG